MATSLPALKSAARDPAEPGGTKAHRNSVREKRLGGAGSKAMWQDTRTIIRIPTHRQVLMKPLCKINIRYMILTNL